MGPWSQLLNGTGWVVLTVAQVVCACIGRFLGEHSLWIAKSILRMSVRGTGSVTRKPKDGCRLTGRDVIEVIRLFPVLLDIVHEADS